MFSQLQQMDEQLDAIENTAKKLDGEFQNSNQVCNLYHYMYHTWGKDQSAALWYISDIALQSVVYYWYTMARGCGFHI